MPKTFTFNPKGLGEIIQCLIATELKQLTKMSSLSISNELRSSATEDITMDSQLLIVYVTYSTTNEAQFVIDAKTILV